MKKLGILSLVFGALLLSTVSCNKQEIDKPEPTEATSFKQLEVPADFTWSAIDRGALKVSFYYEGKLTNALDNTPLDLLNEHDGLLDRMTIIHGEVAFAYMVPSSSRLLKIYVQATDFTEEVSIDQNELIVNLTQLPLKESMLDSDNDGIADLYDDFPNDSERVYGLSFPPSLTNKSFKNTTEEGTPVYNYPSGDDYYYQIYEDLWPSQGDYDLNDLVLQSKIGWDRYSNNELKHVYTRSIVQAAGGSIHIGLGFELFKSVGDSKTYMDDVTTWYGSAPDPDVKNGTICFNNLREWQRIQYSNTSAEGVNAKPDTLVFQAYLEPGTGIEQFELLSYLFRTNDPGHQVRTFGTPPTASADMSFFDTYNDASPTEWDGSVGRSFHYPLQGVNAFYRTENNHPWAVEFIAGNFLVAEEKTDILIAYPQFRAWAESGGTENQSWFDHPDMNHVYVPTYE
jgi:LruC domain-containing protein